MPNCLRRFLLFVCLLLAGAGAFAQAGGDLQTVRLHFHRPSHDYLGWGLYVWGPGLKLPRTVTWDKPLEPSGVDTFGIYFDIQVAPATSTINFILHRGEEKSWPEDMSADLVRQGRELWVMEGSGEVFASLPKTQGAFELGAEADRQRLRQKQMLAAAAGLTLLLLLLAVRWTRQRMARSRDELATQLQLLVKTQGELKEQGERLRSSSADDLTGLPTRGAVNQALEHALAVAERDGGALAVLFVDLDGFKAVNDSAGHDAGDAVLRSVAQRLREVLRQSDVVGRVGGDEFVVVAEQLASPVQAFRLGRKLVRAAAEPIEFQGQRHQVGASVGLALYPEDGRDAASLWKAADSAMYAAKRAGKGACRLQSAAQQAAIDRLLQREASLRQALDDRALRFALEPVVDLSSGLIVGQRAQASWLHEAELLPLLPTLELADDPVLVERVDGWLLRAAVRAATQAPDQGWLLLQLGAAGPSMAGSALLAELPARVRDVLAEEGQPPQRLMLQFPGRWLADTHRPLDLLLRLRAQGLRIAFAGVGEPELSVQRLIDAPVDLLLIDAAAGLNSALVRALAAVGAQCGYQLAASGIEQAAQRRWAQAAGCQLGIGPGLEPDPAPIRLGRAGAE